MKKITAVLLFFVLFTCSSDDNSNGNNNSDPDPIICGIATNIVVNNITSNTAVLNWQANENQINTIVEYGLSGFSLGSGMRIEVAGSTFQITNLMPNTSYDVYIKTLCIDDLESSFSSVQTFATLCDSQEFSGDVTITTQAELDAFGANCYTKITGSLTLGGLGSDITDLSALVNLEEIEVNLTINETQITSLTGLDNLKKINLGGFRINDNPNLTALDHLDSLEYLGLDLTLENNSSLTVINGLENLFNNQSEFYEFYLKDNNNLVAFDFSGAQLVVGVYIYNNSSLTTLNSLENLIEIQDMYIENNDTLIDFCALQNLFANGTYEPSSINFANNQFNPSIQDIIDGNCTE